MNNFSSPDSSEILELVAEVNREYKDIIFNFSTILEKQESSFPGSSEELLRKATNCGAGHESIAIRANGNVTGCPIMENGVAYLGNVFEDDIANLFNSHKNKIFREFYKDQNDPACMHCEYNGYCQNCLVHIYQANLERLAKGEELCGVVLRNKMDKIFNFQYRANSNVTGVVK